MTRQGAHGQAATVEVKVTNLQLIDPGSVGEQPSKGQGHLHYRLDDGPVIATPTPKLSFHGLTPGKHRIVVALAGNDHKPLGPEATNPGAREAASVSVLLPVLGLDLDGVAVPLNLIDVCGHPHEAGARERY